MNTPRTDKLFRKEAMKNLAKYPAAKLCIELETELNAANAKLTKWAPSIDKIAKLETELNAASEKIQKADDQINAYHIECSKQYGPMPTEYQKGVLQGIECGRSLARFNRESTK